MSFFLDLGRVLVKTGEKAKTTRVEHLWHFLQGLRMLLEAMLAHLGAMLGYVRPAGRHLGATWRHDEAQERQDKPR